MGVGFSNGDCDGDWVVDGMIFWCKATEKLILSE